MLKLNAMKIFSITSQVFQRLQKAGLCLSLSSSMKLVVECGRNFDSPIKLWKKEAEDKISAIQVGRYIDNLHLYEYIC